ncbi:MAG: translation factor [Phycisphaerales bacterium]|nr:translation factor [Phycisphaerales bacterium]
MPEIPRAITLLKQGRLVAFPTETVYGLGADAANPRAIDLIYQTKGRPSTNPLIIHVAYVEIAKRYVAHWPAIATELADHFWPGPLTLILPKNHVIPDNATAGLPTIALRVPNHPLARELLRAFDGPLAAPSANRSTRVSPTTAKHVRDEFPDSPAAWGIEGNEPAMILDGGACSVGIESTVLDLTGPTPMILRPGQVTVADLEPIIGPVSFRQTILAPNTAAASPGQHEIHYAPRTPAFYFTTAQRGLIHPEEHGIVVLSPLRVFKDWEKIVAMPNDPIEYAQHLYAVLRKLDTMKLRALYIEIPPDRPEWAAIRDRLTRAATPLPV